MRERLGQAQRITRELYRAVVASRFGGFPKAGR